MFTPAYYRNINGCPTHFSTSRQKIINHFPVHIGKAIVAALVAVDEPFVVDAELVEDGGVQVVDVDAVAHDVVAETSVSPWARHYGERSALKTSAIPMPVIAAALATGSLRSKAPLLGIRPINGRAQTTARPMATSTDARPRLNAVIRTRPKPTRCSAMAESSTTRADGQGINPPEIPSARRARCVMGPSGTWWEWSWWCE
jgi:hypothetical protein